MEEAQVSRSSTREQDKVEPEDDSKPDSPTDISGQGWLYVARKTMREFSKDQCTDQAAALTYYAVLALFPALLAIISLVSVFGQGPSTVDAIKQILSSTGAPAGGTLSKALTSISKTPGAGLALIIGLLSALWSASGYVGSFGRALNRVYGIREGRPVWKLRPVQLLVTLIAVVLVAIVLLSIVLSGPVATAVGKQIGIGSIPVTVWNIAKWPVMLAIVVFIVALLYYATPNIKQPKFRWISVGAIVAIVVWLVVSALFGFYVANFSSYNKTYGSFATVIVFLLWLWITNLALLFGAELDSELERGRELQAGVKAEEKVQLPPRDTKVSDKQDEKEKEDVARGRRLRESRGDTQKIEED
jgi:membrane protein